MGAGSKELRVVLFGATGMIGSGVLQSCLEDEGVSKVLVIGRRSCGVKHPKVQEILHSDYHDYSAITGQLSGYNACFFPLGVTSVGMNEADYTKVTYDLTLAAAEALLKLNPGMSFGYVSGQGTDSTEKGSVMWARVKGRIENKLLSMDFKPAVMYRPGGVQPMKGVASKTAWYRLFYAALGFIMPFLVRNFPSIATTLERLGRAMIRGARGEAGMGILSSRDINRIGA